MDERTLQQLKDAVRAAVADGEHHMVTATSTHHRPIDEWDVYEANDAVLRATKGTNVWGYVTVVRNEKDYQCIAIFLSPRDGR